MYWTLELASKLEDAPWPASRDELIDYAQRSGAPIEVIENLQEMEDEGELYESIEDIWPDYPSKEDFFFDEERVLNSTDIDPKMKQAPPQTIMRLRSEVCPERGGSLGFHSNRLLWAFSTGVSADSAVARGAAILQSRCNCTYGEPAPDGSVFLR